MDIFDIIEKSIYPVILLGLAFFGIYHSGHVDLPCAYHLRNAYDKIHYIHTHGDCDIWESRGLYWSLVDKYLPALGYNLDVKIPNYQNHYETLYKAYSKYMVNLFVSKHLNFDREWSKLSEFDYFIYTFKNYLRYFWYKESFNDIYLLDGEYIDINGYKGYRKFKKDGKYQLSEFGLAYYKTLYMVEYYLQYQDERICKKKKCIRSIMKVGDYTYELKEIENILSTKTIEWK